MIKAILYDLDGVLVDACEWHRVALNRALVAVAGFQISPEEHSAVYNGLPTRVKLAMLVERGLLEPKLAGPVEALKQYLTLDIIAANAKHDPDKVALHAWTDVKGLKRGCVTNSIKETAATMLLMTGQPMYLVSNEDVASPKPDPEGYLHAMVELKVDPKECVIVEDSPKGLAAAHAAGGHVLAVENAKAVMTETIKWFIEEVEAKS